MMRVTTHDTCVDGWQSANHSIPLARTHQAAFHVMPASKPGSGGQFRGYVPSLDFERGRQAGGTGHWDAKEFPGRACLGVNTQVGQLTRIVLEPESSRSLHGNFERLLIDGHVHVHKSYNEAAFLEAAHANLSRHGRGLPTLLLAEMPEQQVFARWRSGNAAWPVNLTREPSSLVLGGRLVVIAGRQVVTLERIEVLAVGCRENIPNGLKLDATIAAMQEMGAVPVLPWGVGKWSGERGRLVANAAARYRLLLGDNAGRPCGWPRPALFHQYVVLPGTDPLWLKTDQERVGTYGFVLEGHFDSDRPAAGVVNALQNLTQSPPVFGNRVGPYRFLRQQLGLRFSR